MAIRIINGSNKPYIKDKSKVTETVGKSKYFTKPFADAVKSKFNIDMTGKTSEEFEWVKPFVNSEIIVKVGRRSDGNYYIICRFKDDNYNYVNALVGSNEISKFKKILSKI